MSAILKEVEDMTCPRCGSDKIRVMVKSPVGDAWEVYVCETCVYSWRSTGYSAGTTA